MIKTLDECKSAVIDFLEKSKTKYCTKDEIKNDNYPLQYIFQEMMDCNFNKDADQAHTDLIAFKNNKFLDGMKTKFDSFSSANEITYNNEETEFDNGSRILTDPRGEADMIDHVRMGHLLYAVAKNNPQLDIERKY